MSIRHFCTSINRHCGTVTYAANCTNTYVFFVWFLRVRKACYKNGNNFFYCMNSCIKKSNFKQLTTG